MISVNDVLFKVKKIIIRLIKMTTEISTIDLGIENIKLLNKPDLRFLKL
tara:strand:- start:1 stop:147 length:147 start_codon:yes stop_codon:yes gene_type:complete